MRKPDARQTQSHRAFGALCMLFALGCLASCDVYDPELLQLLPRPSGSGAAPMDAGKDSSADEDAGDEDAGEDPACTFAPYDEFCPMSCKETCNDLDDNCNGLVDETGSGKLCDLYKATSVCVTGTCLVASCERGYVDCNDRPEDGCEATLDSVQHCGSCTNKCVLANATPECVSGRCEIARCTAGWDDCDGKSGNGCERPLNNLTDCGACGAPCRVAHATTECGSGKCSFAACEAGWGDCNRDTGETGGGDGCETDLGAPANCGACGNKCPTDKPYCAGGACTAIVCDEGTADCNGDNVMCETELNTVTNCGACGVVCGSVANATVNCNADGACEPTCNAGFDSCDDSFGNGCEIDLHTLANCGACGTSCAHANAASACPDGNCNLSTCNAGYGNCNNNAADGCEERLNSAVHCGQCSRPCTLSNASSSCSSGSCQVSSCNAGFGNCDANASNGCETNLQTSAQHCSACGMACAAGFVCQAGRCVCDGNNDCPSGQSCCGGACVDVRSSQTHCGACGAACGSGQTCCSGSCRALASDFNNCGSCGRSCGSNSNRCTNGACRCTDDSPCGGFLQCCANGCHTIFLCQ
jgi:hypothetical protein